MLNVDELSGRELDTAIAEYVLGWKPFKVGKDAKGGNECVILAPGGKIPDGYQLPNLGTLHRGFLVPRFHRNLDDAISLAQKFGAKMVSIECDLAEMPTQIARAILRSQIESLIAEGHDPDFKMPC